MSPNKSKRSCFACRSWQTSVGDGDSQPPTTAKAPAKPPNNARKPAVKKIGSANVLALLGTTEICRAHLSIWDCKHSAP